MAQRSRREWQRQGAAQEWLAWPQKGARGQGKQSQPTGRREGGHRGAGVVGFAAVSANGIVGVSAGLGNGGGDCWVGCGGAHKSGG
jgi:hypothetical protein